MTLDLPTARRIGAWPTGSPDWHAARRDGLGGSEIAAVLGLSKWHSPFSLWHYKAGLTPDLPVNEEMEAGTLLEPVILAKWEAKQDGHLTLLNMPTPSAPSPTFCHVDRPWQIANPDGRAVALGSEKVTKGVEAKFALYPDDFGDPGTDQIPVYYRAQILWYADTLGIPDWDLEVFIGSCAEFRTYHLDAITPDAQADIAVMRQKAQEFLNTLPGRPGERRPDIDQHSATYQTVRQLHSQIDDVKVELPDAVAREYIQAQQALKAAEARATGAKSAVADRMGNAKQATWLGDTIARRQARGDGAPYVVAARNLPKLQETAA